MKPTLVSVFLLFTLFNASAQEADTTKWYWGMSYSRYQTNLPVPEGEKENAECNTGNVALKFSRKFSKHFMLQTGLNLNRIVYYWPGVSGHSVLEKPPYTTYYIPYHYNYIAKHTFIGVPLLVQYIAGNSEGSIIVSAGPEFNFLKYWTKDIDKASGYQDQDRIEVVHSPIFSTALVINTTINLFVSKRTAISFGVTYKRFSFTSLKNYPGFEDGFTTQFNPWAVGFDIGFVSKIAKKQPEVNVSDF